MSILFAYTHACAGTTERSSRDPIQAYTLHSYLNAFYTASVICFDKPVLIMKSSIMSNNALMVYQPIERGLRLCLADDGYIHYETERTLRR